MNRNQRVAQPKTNNDEASAKGKYDSFLDHPTMIKNHNSNSRQGMIRRLNHGPNTYTANLSKSQERFSGNHESKKHSSSFLEQRYGKDEYNDIQNNGYVKPNSGVSSARPNHMRNASATIAHKNDLNNSMASNVRPMPVHERENVFNEWGAVIQHQDEIDRELRRQQDNKLRERQKNYKMQLDMQYQEYQNKKKGSMTEMARKEEDMLKQYQKGLEVKRKAEDDKRSQLMNQQKEAAFQSINEMHSIK